MRNGLLGAVLGAVIAGLIAYLIWARPLTTANDLTAASTTRVQQLEAWASTARTRKPRNAVITLTQAPGAPMGQCVGSIDVPKMGANIGEEMKWCVVDGEGEDQANQCRPPRAWAVYLDFEGNRSPFASPNQARRVRIGRGCKRPKIADDVTVGQVFVYKVSMQPDIGQPYVIVDPDIEIEPPGDFIPPAPPPPAPPPGNR